MIDTIELDDSPSASFDLAAGEHKVFKMKTPTGIIIYQIYPPDYVILTISPASSSSPTIR